MSCGYPVSKCGEMQKDDYRSSQVRGAEEVKGWRSE